MLAPAAAMAAMAAMVLAAAGAEARAVILAMAAMAAGLALVTPERPEPEAAEEEEVQEGFLHLIHPEPEAGVLASLVKAATVPQEFLQAVLPAEAGVVLEALMGRTGLLKLAPVLEALMAAGPGVLGAAVLARQQLEHEERSASSGPAPLASSRQLVLERHK